MQQSGNIPEEELNSILIGSSLIQVDNTYIPTKQYDNQFCEELSEIEYNFCLEFIHTRDIALSMKVAAPEYKNMRGWELLKLGRKILNKSHVKIYLSELKQELLDKADLRKEDIVLMLRDLKHRAKTDGEKSIELRCIEILAKTSGLLINKTETTNINELRVRFNDEFEDVNYLPESDVKEIE
jgi:hypothetical protein